MIEYVGNTPIIKFKVDGVTILGKAEFLNPSGSVKDRLVSRVITEAEERGLIFQGDTLVEATSGNTGIAFAMFAALRGYKMKIVMPSNMSEERKQMFRYYGAELIEVGAGDFEGAIVVRDQLAEEHGWFNCNQFHTQWNIDAHYDTTGPEIKEEVDASDWIPQAFVAGTGTGGTIMGTGRYLREWYHGIKVVAVEPASGIRELAKSYTISNPIHWVADALPDLTEVFKLQTKFDLILLSAVWMHIAPSSRERAFRKLSSLLKPNGKLIISLRHGKCDDERTMYDVSADELAKFASQFGLTFRLLSSALNADELGRDNVTWQTVLLTLPDNGTGAFPLIRNIVVNDSKSSTYKVGLLRALLRIAEGHPGAVIEQTNEHVTLPIGLVALYWLKLYKPLVDQFSMQQNINSRRGLGFIKESGWQRFTTYSSNDFYIGAHYSDTDIVQGLYQALKELASNIKKIPSKFPTFPGSS